MNYSENPNISKKGIDGLVFLALAGFAFFMFAVFSGAFDPKFKGTDFNIEGEIVNITNNKLLVYDIGDSLVLEKSTYFRNNIYNKDIFWNFARKYDGKLSQDSVVRRGTDNTFVEYLKQEKLGIIVKQDKWFFHF